MEDLEEYDITNNITYKLYSALTNFKRAVFACTTTDNTYNSTTKEFNNPTESGVVYDSETGRIKQLTFVQLPN